MHALATQPQAPQDTFDQRVLLHGISWTEFEIIQAIKGERSVPRLTYLEGTLELMSPSFEHENIKKTLARIVEQWAIERDITLRGVGSWTLKNAPRKRGVEPDECYILGSERKDRPDLAIEVIWTSGGIDKLEVYLYLSVPEVWLWAEGKLLAYRLVGDHYERIPRSDLLPDLDLDLVARLAAEPDQHAAIRAFRNAIRGA